jgi:hypothetical protein
MSNIAASPIRQPEEWPWLYVFLMFTVGFFVVTNAGKSLGLDALLTRWQPGPFKGEGLPPILHGYLRSASLARGAAELALGRGSN